VWFQIVPGERVEVAAGVFALVWAGAAELDVCGGAAIVYLTALHRREVAIVPARQPAGVVPTLGRLVGTLCIRTPPLLGVCRAVRLRGALIGGRRVRRAAVGRGLHHHAVGELAVDGRVSIQLPLCIVPGGWQRFVRGGASGRGVGRRSVSVRRIVAGVGGHGGHGPRRGDGGDHQQGRLHSCERRSCDGQDVGGQVARGWWEVGVGCYGVGRRLRAIRGRSGAAGSPGREQHAKQCARREGEQRAGARMERC
jgi:hypothetical protein